MGPRSADRGIWRDVSTKDSKGFVLQWGRRDQPIAELMTWHAMITGMLPLTSVAATDLSRKYAQKGRDRPHGVASMGTRQICRGNSVQAVGSTISSCFNGAATELLAEMQGCRAWVATQIRFNGAASSCSRKWLVAPINSSFHASMGPRSDLLAEISFDGADFGCLAKASMGPRPICRGNESGAGVDRSSAGFNGAATDLSRKCD